MLSVFKKIIKNKRGVSLMEMVVVMAVFSIVITIALDLYFAAHRSQRKTTAMQRIQSDARYSLEAIAREVRVDKIDYQYYIDNDIDLTFDLSTLALRDDEDVSIIFKKVIDASGGDCPETPEQSSVCYLSVSQDGGAWTSLTPKNIYVDTLNFYISPTSDPLIDGTKEQPRVTIIFGSHNISNNHPEDQKSLILQTTASSRYYGQ